MRQKRPAPEQRFVNSRSFAVVSLGLCLLWLGAWRVAVAQDTAKEAFDMGLVNCVVPHDKLDEEVDKWCAEIKERSPTAIAIAKRSFNADTEHIRAIGALGFEAVALYYGTEESKEGGRAFREKRPPKFR